MCVGSSDVKRKGVANYRGLWVCKRRDLRVIAITGFQIEKKVFVVVCSLCK